MKSRDNIVKFLSIFSSLSSTIGLLDKLSCQPPEQTDLPDPLQNICATHSTNILCQSHAVGWLLLLCTGDVGSIARGLCQAWDRHKLTKAETELNEWEQNGRIWQRLRWSWTLEIIPLFFSLHAGELSQKCHTNGFGLVASLGHVVHLREYNWIPKGRSYMKKMV